MSGTESAKPSAARRVRPLLLVLLLVWAVCMFIVVDLFLNVTEFDSIRPRTGLYAATRLVAHRMVGEPCAEYGSDVADVVALAREPAQRWEDFRPDYPEPGSAAGRLEAADGRRAPRSIPHGTDSLTARHGSYTQWTDPGGVPGEGEYKNGQRDGTWTWYWPSGQKREERNYSEGVLEGRTASWYEDGTPQTEEEWKAGKPAGRWRWWHSNGTLGAAEEYEDGALRGPVQRWHANGKKAAEVVYWGGVPGGRATFWHENGQKSEEGQFQGGVRGGEWTSWDTDGSVLRVEHYVAGRKTNGSQPPAPPER